MSTVGTLAVNRKKTFGMYIWILSNVIWIYYWSFVKFESFQVYMYVVFTATNIEGIYRWKKQDRLKKS